jgi:hypothetical protein
MALFFLVWNTNFYVLSEIRTAVHLDNMHFQYRPNYEEMVHIQYRKSTEYEVVSISVL